MGNHFEDQLLRYGGGVASTTMTGATVALVLAAILLFFFLPQKYVIVPFLFVSIFMPMAQVVVISGLHFMVFRIMLPFAWVRVIGGKLFGHSNNDGFRFGAIDKAIVLWVLVDTVCFTLLWGEWGAFVNRLGFLYNVFGTYFLLRFLIRDREDVNRTIRTLAIVCALVAVFMVREQLTGRNTFSVFGVVPEVTLVREGRLRSQAASAHAILAGTLGATLLPLFVGLLWQGGKSKIAVLGVLSAVIMTLASGSATPLLACLAGIAALCMWPFRRRLRLFRWGVVIGLISLHLVMRAPVWALIGRISVVGGASGWHRYELINQAILHFGDWWLLGARNPSNWGRELGDTSDAYVEAAVTGGLLTLLFFLGILWQSFRALGIAGKAAEKNRRLELLLWAYGAALFSNVVAFFGTTYFDQTILVWYALLAMICAVTSIAPVLAPESENTPGDQVPPLGPATGFPGGAEGKPLTVFGSGKQTQCFCYVADVVTPLLN